MDQIFSAVDSSVYMMYKISFWMMAYIMLHSTLGVYCKPTSCTSWASSFI